MAQYAFSGTVFLKSSSLCYKIRCNNRVPYQSFPDWQKEQNLSFLGCPSSRCQLTPNRTLLPNVGMFDAIVFHQFNFDWNDLPSVRCGIHCSPQNRAGENASSWHWRWEPSKGPVSRSRAVYAKLESNSKPERARVCQRVAVRASESQSGSHREP